MYFKFMDDLCPCDAGEKALPAWLSKPMLVQCWTDAMLRKGAQYQPCVWLQADIACAFADI